MYKMDHFRYGIRLSYTSNQNSYIAICSIRYITGRKVVSTYQHLIHNNLKVINSISTNNIHLSTMLSTISIHLSTGYPHNVIVYYTYITSYPICCNSHIQIFIYTSHYPISYSIIPISIIKFHISYHRIHISQYIHQLYSIIQ